MRHQLATLSALVALSVASLGLAGCGGKASLTEMPVRDLFEMGKQEYQKKKYLKAIPIFQTIVYNYPGESIVDTAQYYLALSYFGEEEYELAQVEFNRLALNYPSSVYFEHAVFMRAVCFFESTPRHYGLDQSDLETAIRQLEDFIIDYPESELVPQAQQYLLTARTRMARKFYSSGVVYSRIGAYESAIIYFQKVIDNYTDTEYAPLATFDIAAMDYKLGEYGKARRKLEDFLVVFPDHERSTRAEELIVEVAFKAGVKAFNTGDFALAKERFEAFKRDFPDNDKTKKVDSYLKEVETKLLIGSQEGNADS